MVLLEVERPVVADLRRDLLDIHAKQHRRLQFLRRNRPHQRGAAGINPLDKAVEAGLFLALVLDRMRGAECHHGAVIQGMAKGAAPQDESVDMAARQAHRDAAALRPQHAARRRAVPVEPVALAPEQGRRHIGQPVDDIADMAHQRRVEDRVDGVAVVMRPLRVPAHGLAARLVPRASRLLRDVGKI